MKKRIVYLFGSGASHAVINAINPNKQFLTADIRQEISEKRNDKGLTNIPAYLWNELLDPDVDIEHLISILETNYHFDSAQKIREFYHDAIISLTKEFLENINNPIYKPNLYSILFDLHSIRKIKEKVVCFMTLNYEDIFEKVLKTHFDLEIDYLIGKTKRYYEKLIPVLKLHGSFNWENTRPIKLGESLKMKSGEALWIPPGVDKKKETYPFNILWGKAFEYLKTCDVLRVIGCSLSRNDWGLIPMIYTAMRLKEANHKLELEIIDFIDVGNNVKKSYPYLSIKSIIEIKEFREYLIDVFSLDASKPIPEYVKGYISSDASKKINIYEWWLKAKRFELLNAGINIETRKKYFMNFN